MEIPIWEAQNKNCSNFTSAYLTVLLLFNIFSEISKSTSAHILFIWCKRKFFSTPKDLPRTGIFSPFQCRVPQSLQNMANMSKFSIYDIILKHDEYGDFYVQHEKITKTRRQCIPIYGDYTGNIHSLHHLMYFSIEQYNERIYIV